MTLHIFCHSSIPRQEGTLLLGPIRKDYLAIHLLLSVAAHLWSIGISFELVSIEGDPIESPEETWHE